MASGPAEPRISIFRCSSKPRGRRYGTANHPVFPWAAGVFRDLVHFSTVTDSPQQQIRLSGARCSMADSPRSAFPMLVLAPPLPGSRRLGCGGSSGLHGGQAADLWYRRIRSRLPRLPRGAPRSPPGRRHAKPLLGRAQLSVRRRVRGSGGRRGQAGLRRAGVGRGGRTAGEEGGEGAGRGEDAHTTSPCKARAPLSPALPGT